MDDLETRLRRGQQAQDLLNNDIFTNVLGQIRKRILDQIEHGIGVVDSDDDRRLVETLRALQSIKTEIKAIADDGRLARNALEKNA